MIAYGDVPVSSVRLGDSLALSAYWGDEQVWVAEPPTFSVEGTTFSPQLETSSAVSVQWLDETDSVVSTDLTPTIVWEGVGPHTVRLLCSDYREIVTLNLGFHNQQDNGRDSLPLAYNRATQGVLGIDNLQSLTGLQRFMSARTDGVSSDPASYSGGLLTGVLNFAGMNQLEFVECFGSDVQSVNLTGCTSLVRLCLEACDVTMLDLTPVLDNLQDLRAATQQGGTLNLEEWDRPASMLWHFCVRGQTLTGLPISAHLPAVEQFWAWRSALFGDLVIDSVADMDSVMLSGTAPGPLNTITSLDLSGVPFTEGATRLYAQSMPSLTSVNLTGVSPINNIRLNGCALPQDNIDAIFAIVNAWGTSGGNLQLADNAAPSSVSETAIDALIGRGWTLTYEPIVNPDPGSLWEDDFEVIDGPLTAPWLTPIGGMTAEVVSGSLQLVGGSGYQRVWAMPELTVSDYEVEIEFTGTPSTMSWWGIIARMNATGDGMKCLFPNDAIQAPRMDTASTGSGAVATASGPGVPASWSQPGVHTLTLRLSGLTATVLLDGQEAWSRTASGIVGSGTGVGICGESQGRFWDSIRVRPL